MDVDGGRFMCRLALVLSTDFDSGDAPEVVSRMLAGPVDQQVVLFVDQVLPVKFAHLEVRRQLDSVGRAGFLAVTAKDAAREVDAEEIRVAPSVFVLRRLKRDAPDRTGNGAQVARHAALLAVRVAGENDSAAITRREVRLLLGILNRDPLLECMEEHVPDGSKHAEHRTNSTTELPRRPVTR